MLFFNTEGATDPRPAWFGRQIDLWMQGHADAYGEVFLPDT